MKDYSTKPFTFKKKPVAIEAIKWIGTNFDTIKMFDRKGFGRFHPLGWNSKKLKVFNFQATN